MKNSTCVRKKNPPDGFQHFKGCFRYFFIALTTLLFWSGLFPIKIDTKTGTLVDFKLISLSSVLTFVRLFIFNFPFLIFPWILHDGGPAKKEYEALTGRNFTYQHPVPSVGAIYEAENYLAFLVYILPLALSSVQSKHFNKMYHIFMDFINSFVMEEKPQLINVRHVLFPLMGFLLFALGKLLNLVHVLIEIDLPILSINVFCTTCYIFLSHFPLHLLLAVHEHFLYQELDMFHTMCSSTLRGNNRPKALIERAKVLPALMEAIQGGFGLFLLVDLTLMLVYWLLHTFHAYFTFQVKIFKRISFSLTSRVMLCLP